MQRKAKLDASASGSCCAACRNWIRLLAYFRKSRTAARNWASRTLSESVSPAGVFRVSTRFSRSRTPNASYVVKPVVNLASTRTWNESRASPSAWW